MPTRTAKTPTALPVLTPNAAGIDGGATAVYGAVPQARAQDPLRGFATFTQDLDAVADWLQACGVQTVAMESTGGYWIPLCQILPCAPCGPCCAPAPRSSLTRLPISSLGKRR